MIDLNKLLQELTDQEIIDIMASLGATRYVDNPNEIIFPTICHHENEEDGSMKLYYYKENHMFHCYTECSESFNLFTLIEKVFILRGGNKVHKKEDKKNPGDFYFFDTVLYVLNRSENEGNFDLTFHSDAYVSERDKFKRKQREIDLPVYPSQVLDAFEKIYPVEWLQEGITKDAMDKYEIKYSISRNKIIIPHYDIDHQLIGIRGRALDAIEADMFGKYMPVEIEGKWYAHPLSQNLYGLYVAQKAIQRTKRVVIFEGEKSCLLAQGYQREDNNTVACCGSSINKTQVKILMKYCMPEEIIIAFDKEYQDVNSEKAEKYFNKLYNMGKKYSNYANFSFIFDRENLLSEKDSPIDKGFETYKKLLGSRVIVK